MISVEIPKQAGAILLPNVVTFPHGMLPLHIFEPRYRKMLEDAFESNSMICVANLISDETPDPSKCTSKIGTIGIIRASQKQKNGHSDLILHSLSRVEFLSWERSSTYPKANISPITNIVKPLTNATEIVIDSLRDATSRFVAKCPKELIDQIDETLNHVSKDLATLTDVVAQQFISDTSFRQELLEENNPNNRAEALIRHLRIQKSPM